jgi:hypothetical protein
VQMNKIRLLKERLEWGKYTLDDLDYLKKVLNAIVDGRDANDAFNIIPSKKGVKRSDYLKHLQIIRAFHMISCEIDRTVFVQHKGKFYEDETQKGKKARMKAAINNAAATTGLNPTSLARYWNMPKYQSLKSVLLQGEWL